MTGWRGAVAALVALGVVGCKRPARPGPTGEGTGGGASSDPEPPVALNGDSPIQYPPRLYDQRVEGDVLLRLFVDSAGRLAPESSKVAESSGYPALDSAALAGARQLHFAPGRRHGLPVATAFLQPIEFRHPAADAVMRGGPEPGSSPPQPPLPPRRRARTRADPSRPRLDTSHATPDTTRARPDSSASPY